MLWSVYGCGPIVTIVTQVEQPRHELPIRLVFVGRVGVPGDASEFLEPLMRHRNWLCSSATPFTLDPPTVAR